MPVLRAHDGEHEIMNTLSKTPLRSIGLLVTAAMAFAATPANAQDAAIRGVWQISRPTPEVRPETGSIPFTSEGRERYNENRSARTAGRIDDYDITRSRCSNPGVPRLALTPMRFKIWNGPTAITFDYEWNRAIRQVDMRGTERERPLVPNITGLSSGTWEGNTLVARTFDVAEKTLIDDLIPHSDQMVVVERYRLIDQNTLENRITIEDPVMFSRPWSFVVTYNRQPDTTFPEDVCLDRINAGGPAFPNG